MKYFTLDWYHAPDYWDDVPDQPKPSRRERAERLARHRAAWEAYTRHLAEMQGVFPDDVLALARLPGVDDALVVKVRHDRARRVLALTLRAGDGVIGYYDLILTYEGAEISPEDERTLARIARTTRSDRRHDSDAVTHELDRANDGRVEHRFLFHPGVWFAVRCDALHWVRLARPDRRLPRLRDRFPGGPSSEDREAEKGSAELCTALPTDTST